LAEQELAVFWVRQIKSGRARSLISPNAKAGTQAASLQLFADVRAEEPGAAGDEDTLFIKVHRLPLCFLLSTDTSVPKSCGTMGVCSFSGSCADSNTGTCLAMILGIGSTSSTYPLLISHSR